MTTAVVNGINVAYDDVGDSTNALLLVHGHPFNRSMWRPQLHAARDAGWRVVAPDLRGYGNTTVVPGKTPLDVFANDVAALLDYLDIDKVVVGGLSMGGQIAMEFARTFPDRLRGLLLAATFAQAETEEGKRNRNATADRILRDGMASYADELLPKMLSALSITTLPAVAAHVAAMMRTTDPGGAAAALRGRAERPSYDVTLANLAVPALVVAGSEDAFTLRDDAEHVRDLLRDAELVWLDGVGHMPNLESPDEFNAALVRLLARVASRTNTEMPLPGSSADAYVNEPVRFPPLAIVDIAAEAAAVTESYRNQVLSRVNGSCLRLAVVTGDYPWHRHTRSDELFLVVEGLLEIELEGGRLLRLSPWQSVVIPAGQVHRTRGVGRTVNVCFEDLAADTVFVEAASGIPQPTRRGASPSDRPGWRAERG
jgi:pimeloyl-ACP methyl ester carboxylesterase/mannose-6-phosphate isomerase-like protein (cupin superfamily)